MAQTPDDAKAADRHNELDIPSPKRFGRTIRRTRRWFRGLHDMIIPAGTPVEWIDDDTGGWAVLPKHVVLDSDTRELFSHDAARIYIWVDAIDVQPHGRRTRLTQPLVEPAVRTALDTLSAHKVVI